MSRSLVALILIAVLSFGGAFDAIAQSSKHHRKAKKPKSPPCRTGCKAGHVGAPSRRRYTGRRGRAKKNFLISPVRSTTPRRVRMTDSRPSPSRTRRNVWGARAALALGYEEYSKNRNGAGSRMVNQKRRTTPCSASTPCTGPRRRSGRWDAVRTPTKCWQTIQHDYPNTAMREQLLEAFRAHRGPARTRSGSHRRARRLFRHGIKAHASLRTCPRLSDRASASSRREGLSNGLLQIPSCR